MNPPFWKLYIYIYILQSIYIYICYTIFCAESTLADGVCTQTLFRCPNAQAGRDDASVGLSCCAWNKPRIECHQLEVFDWHPTWHISTMDQPTYIDRTCTPSRGVYTRLQRTATASSQPHVTSRTAGPRASQALAATAGCAGWAAWAGAPAALGRPGEVGKSSIGLVGESFPL